MNILLSGLSQTGTASLRVDPCEFCVDKWDEWVGQTLLDCSAG